MIENFLFQSQLQKTSFVPQNDDDMRQSLKNLNKQVFQLSYFGKISAEYMSSLEVSERNFMYNLLVEQLESEKKHSEEESRRAKAEASRAKASGRSSATRRGR